MQIIYSNHKKLESPSHQSESPAKSQDPFVEAATAQIGLEELLEGASVRLDITFAPYKGTARQYSGEELYLFHHQQRSALVETNLFLAQGKEEKLVPIMAQMAKLYEGCGYITDVNFRQLDH